MYAIFLALHSILRWLVLLSLLWVIGASLEGWLRRRPFARRDELSRSTATGISHLQLLIGLVLYGALSPVTRYFLQNGADGNEQVRFFGLYHISLMFGAIVVMSIGSSLSKKAATDAGRFKTLFFCFTLALGLILLGIPWFRPFFRSI